MTEPRKLLQPCVEAGRASVEDGVVVLDGPDGVAVTMTAEAAELTGESLLQAAAKIRGSRPGSQGKAGVGLEP